MRSSTRDLNDLLAGEPSPVCKKTISRIRKDIEVEKVFPDRIIEDTLMFIMNTLH
jgi:hypothetical protein